mmetsp:Transcript_5159/g.7147  ORF Transcript_5159/g.7147 Transcript_5159/m.7147 type:complete len:113 (+) Transcript_5159:102-440(+)
MYSGRNNNRGANARHTILLVQPNDRKDSRTFHDFDAIAHACDGIVKMFEDHLKFMFPNQPNIQYDISDLFKYMDDLWELSGLIFDNQIGAYIPEDRESLKQRVFNYLRNQSG